MEVNQEMLRILDIKTKLKHIMGQQIPHNNVFLLVTTVTYKDKVAVKPH